MPSNSDEPWGLIVPGRPNTPSEGAAQQYTRIGPAETQKIKTFDNGTCLEFGHDDPVDEFQPGHPFLNQIYQIDTVVRDIRVARQRHEGENARQLQNGGEPIEQDPFDGFRITPVHQVGMHVTGSVTLESGTYFQVPSKFASCGNVVSVYSVQNKSDTAGELHNGGSCDTRFGKGGKQVFWALPPAHQDFHNRNRSKRGNRLQTSSRGGLASSGRGHQRFHSTVGHVPGSNEFGEMMTGPLYASTGGFTGLGGNCYGPFPPGPNGPGREFSHVPPSPGFQLSHFQAGNQPGFQPGNLQAREHQGFRSVSAGTPQMHFEPRNDPMPQPRFQREEFQAHQQYGFRHSDFHASQQMNLHPSYNQGPQSLRFQPIDGYTSLPSSQAANAQRSQQAGFHSHGGQGPSTPQDPSVMEVDSDEEEAHADGGVPTSEGKNFAFHGLRPNGVKDGDVPPYADWVQYDDAHPRPSVAFGPPHTVEERHEQRLQEPDAIFERYVEECEKYHREFVNKNGYPPKHMPQVGRWSIPTTVVTAATPLKSAGVGNPIQYPPQLSPIRSERNTARPLPVRQEQSSPRLQEGEMQRTAMQNLAALIAEVPAEARPSLHPSQSCGPGPAVCSVHHGDVTGSQPFQASETDSYGSVIHRDSRPTNSAGPSIDVTRPFVGDQVLGTAQSVVDGQSSYSGRARSSAGFAFGTNDPFGALSTGRGQSLTPGYALATGRPTRSGKSHSASPSLSGGTQFGDAHAFGIVPRLGGARHIDSGQILSPSQSPAAGWQPLNSGETLSDEDQDRQVFRDRMPRVNIYEKILEAERQMEARRRGDETDGSARPSSGILSMESVPASVLPPAGFTRSRFGSPVKDSMLQPSVSSMAADLATFYSRQRELRAENEEARRGATSMLDPTPAARPSMKSARSVKPAHPKSLSSMGMGPLRGSGRHVGIHGNDGIQHPMSMPPTRVPSPNSGPATPNKQVDPFSSNRSSPDRGESGSERSEPKPRLKQSVRRRLFEL